MARARKPVSPKMRFDVFKRDHFTCQYCGKIPPSVVLEIDHIVAVSKGGDGDIGNLITSCFECNRGKAAGNLETIPDTIKQRLEREKELAAQMAEYNEFMLTKRKKEDETINSLGEYWCDYVTHKTNCGYTFGPQRAVTMRTFLNHIVTAEILGYMEMAIDKFQPRVLSDDDRSFRYFCGICWKIIRERKGTGNENQH